jgi:DNA-binding response OmpR family regulator
VLPPSQTTRCSLPPRVLIVDDDRDVRTALAGVLAQEGYVVETAADGRQALAMLRAERPDLILLDLVLPAMNGFELLAELHREHGAREAKIIVVTSTRGFAAKDLGVAAVICKPFDVDRLLGTIKSIVPT